MQESSSKTIGEIRTQAARALRLSRATTDQDASQALEQFASELETQAALLEAASRSSAFLPSERFGGVKRQIVYETSG